MLFRSDGIPETWWELIKSGHADIDELNDGPFKDAITEFVLAAAKIENRLDELEYEPG